MVTAGIHGGSFGRLNILRGNRSCSCRCFIEVMPRFARALCYFPHPRDHHRNFVLYTRNFFFQCAHKPSSFPAPRPKPPQVLLCNPLCFVAYATAASMFFRRRIPFEEALLKKFYPDEYPEYVSKTFVGIPFLPRSWSRPSRPHDVAAGVTRHGVAAAPRGGGQERSTPVLARQGSGDERCPLYPGAGDNDGSTDGS